MKANLKNSDGFDKQNLININKVFKNIILKVLSLQKETLKYDY